MIIWVLCENHKNLVYHVEDICITHIRMYEYYTEMEFIKPSVKTTVKVIHVPLKK